MKKSHQFNFGKLTQTAGTAIVRTIPGRSGRQTRLTSMSYTALATAHTVVVMTAFGDTTVASAALAAQAEVVLTADPAGDMTPPASGDYVVFEKPDGTLFTTTVSSWAASTKTMTLAENVPIGGIAVAAKCWFFGAPGDFTNAQYSGQASLTIRWSEHPDVGIATSPGFNEPILIYSANASNAGTIQEANGIYV